MPNVVEIVHKKDQHMFFLLDLGEHHVECGSCWVQQDRTLRYEMSSMFGCICDCSHCEYSYIYNGDLTADQLEEQFTLLKETSGTQWKHANEIVISFCRMGEPTMNDDLMKFIRRIWNVFRRDRKRFIFEIPTVLPELGVDTLLDAKRFAAVEGAMVRPVVTLNAMSDHYRKQVVGLEVVPEGKLGFLLAGWHRTPAVLLQPVEAGLIVSWDLKKAFEHVDLIFQWNHLYNSIPITLRNHKLVTHRSHYNTNIKHVTKGFKEKRGLTITEYDKCYFGASYPHDLDPGQYFSLLMKDNLVRAVARYKAVS
jgi:hypothetical protein